MQQPSLQCSRIKAASWLLLHSTKLKELPLPGVNRGLGADSSRDPHGIFYLPLFSQGRKKGDLDGMLGKNNSL